MPQTPPTAPDPLSVLLAGGEGARLHELGACEAKPALPLTGRRLADWAVAAVAAAGLTRLRVVLGPRSEALADHLRERWGDRLDLAFVPARATTLASLHAALGAEQEALVLPADQIHALDLRALLAAHRASGRTATVAAGRPVAPAVVTARPWTPPRATSGTTSSPPSPPPYGPLPATPTGATSTRSTTSARPRSTSARALAGPCRPLPKAPCPRRNRAAPSRSRSAACA